MIFPTTVNGIPCQCRVTHFVPGTPTRIYGFAMEDCDPPEAEEFEFELLDRRGRPAKWLDRYITPAVEDRLSEERRIVELGQDYESSDDWDR